MWVYLFDVNIVRFVAGKVGRAGGRSCRRRSEFGFDHRLQAMQRPGAGAGRWDREGLFAILYQSNESMNQ